MQRTAEPGHELKAESKQPRAQTQSVREPVPRADENTNYADSFAATKHELCDDF